MIILCMNRVDAQRLKRKMPERWKDMNLNCRRGMSRGYSLEWLCEMNGKDDAAQASELESVSLLHKLVTDYPLNDRVDRVTEVVDLGSFRFDKGGGGRSDW